MVAEERGLIFPVEKQDEQSAHFAQIYKEYYSIRRLRYLAENRIYVSKDDCDLFESLKLGNLLAPAWDYIMRVGANVQELKLLIIKAQSGDLAAYDQLVCQFQDMTVAYAYSVMSDFHLAEDAAQEAFVEAFLCLPKLQELLAFPGWLRRIVFKHCDRLTRNKKVPRQIHIVG